MNQFEENNLLKYFSKSELTEILNIQSQEEKAKVIVQRLFEGKFDKGGKPYVFHLYRVSDKLKGELERTAGLLHDTFEDTEITYADLIEMGFDTNVLDIVKIVTNDQANDDGLSKQEKLEKYSQKIDKVIASKNIHAIRLKESDMSDNFNPERLKELSFEQREWFTQKYQPQLEKLRDYLKKQAQNIQSQMWLDIFY